VPIDLRVRTGLSVLILKRFAPVWRRGHNRPWRGLDTGPIPTLADQDTAHDTVLIVTRMPRLRLAAALVAAAAVLAAGAGAFTLTAGPGGAVAVTGETALPAGWELCILAGLTAPVTQANVADLDAWQAAEGGSTNNSAAYNPFNTRRATDAFGQAIPSVDSSNGFPAFGSWLDGCAATVATLFQTNMAPITAALRAGTVAPPGAFLATVDQSQWCAPSADGTPCYANQIIGTKGTLASALLANSSALEVYGNVKSDLHTYQQDVATTSTDQGVLTARNEELAADQLYLSAAREKLGAAQGELGQFAVDTYVNGGTYSDSSFMNLAGPKPFGPQNANGVVAEQYENIVASELDAALQSAVAAEKSAQSRRDGAAKALSLATITLASDTAAQTRALARLVDDVAAFQKAGACTSAVITVSAPGSPGSPASGATDTSQPANASPNTTATTTTTSTTTTTTAPAPTTTTTTVPPTTNATSTVPTTVPAVKVPITVPTTIPVTTVPPTTVPPTSTTTTTTTAPGDQGSKAPASIAPQTPNPAGLLVLQGCVAALAPPPGQ
jgi:hypothetical protein